MSRELLRQALEALRSAGRAHSQEYVQLITEDTIAAIREYLATPEQEPFAWEADGEVWFDRDAIHEEWRKDARPLYLHSKGE